MSDVSCFWRDHEFQDATLLLSSDASLLEQTRAELQLQATSNGSMDDCDCVCSCKHYPKKRRLNPAPDLEETAISSSNQLTHSASSSLSMSTSKQINSSTGTFSTGKILTIPVHRIVLSSGSAYFKTAISTLIGERSSGAASAAPSTGIQKTLHPIIVVHEDNVDAAEGVVQFLYTKTVDTKFDTASQLMHLLLSKTPMSTAAFLDDLHSHVLWCTHVLFSNSRVFIQIADRWVVPRCVTACCKALEALPTASLTVGDILAIHSPGNAPIPPSLLNTADFQPVLQAAVSRLLQLFGNVPTVIASPTLTSQLLQLPHTALLALLSSDALTTDCEDSVLMLLSWWLYQGGVAGCVLCDKTHLAELMGAIRYSHLSSTYLAQAWALSPILKPTSDQLVELQNYRSLNTPYATLYCKEELSEPTGCCPAGWFKPQRPLSQGAGNTVSVTLVITAAQLAEHLAAVRALKSGGPKPRLLIEHTDFKGLGINLSFISNTAGEEVAGEQDYLFVCVGICTRLPMCSSKAALKFGLPCRHTISIQSNVAGKPSYSTKSPRGLVRVAQGWWNFARDASKLPGDPLVLSWWDPFLVDGHVRLAATFTDERTS